MTNLDNIDKFLSEYYSNYINKFAGKEIVNKDSMDLESLSSLYTAIYKSVTQVKELEKVLEEERNRHSKIYVAVRSLSLGSWHYIKDCWHDFWFWFWGLFFNLFESIVNNTYCWKHNEGMYCKDGSIKKYIQETKQRQKIQP